MRKQRLFLQRLLAVDRRWLVLAACLLIGGYWIGRAGASARQAAPTVMNYSGTLTDANGAPLTGSKNILVQFWTESAGGATPACVTTASAQTLVAGTFTVPLADACADAVHANPDLWVEVLVDGASLGRSKLGAVPFAIESNNAKTADVAASAKTADVATSAKTADVAASAKTADVATSASNATAGGGIATSLSNLQAATKNAVTQVQTGFLAVTPTTAGCGGLGDVTAAVRDCPLTVTFATPFTEPPAVTVGLASIDEYTADGATRFHINMGKVTATGFTVTLGTHYNANVVNSATVHWMAAGH